MPDTANTLRIRTESHSDVADTPPAREYQSRLGGTQFGEALVRRLREAKGAVTLSDFKEEWTTSDNGLVYELSAEVSEAEPTE